MLNDGREYLLTSWELATFPGAAVMLAVLGVTLLGDGLRDWLDPQMRIAKDQE